MTSFLSLQNTLASILYRLVLVEALLVSFTQLLTSLMMMVRLSGHAIHIYIYTFATELKAGFTQQVDVMLEEGNGQDICVRVEGLTERPIDDIAVNGKL